MKSKIIKGITLTRVKHAFGTKVQACAEIGCSRPQLDKWIKQGFIPEKADRSQSVGKNWHNNIRAAGFEPIKLQPL